MTQKEIYWINHFSKVSEEMYEWLLMYESIESAWNQCMDPWFMLNMLHPYYLQERGRVRKLYPGVNPDDTVVECAPFHELKTAIWIISMKSLHKFLEHFPHDHSTDAALACIGLMDFIHRHGDIDYLPEGGPRLLDSFSDRARRFNRSNPIALKMIQTTKNIAAWYSGKIGYNAVFGKDFLEFFLEFDRPTEYHLEREVMCDSIRNSIPIEKLKESAFSPASIAKVEAKFHDTKTP